MMIKLFIFNKNIYIYNIILNYYYKMNVFSSIEGNRFEAKLKIIHNNNQKQLLEIITNYLKKYYKDEYFVLEKETPNVLILNFKGNTNTANCVLRYLKIIKLERIELSHISCNIHIKITNSFTRKKLWNKSKLLLSSLSTLDNNKFNFPKNERYRGLSKKIKNNKTSNNTKYNVIESLYFLNDNKKEILNNNNINNNNDQKKCIETENNIIEYNYIPKKSNNWLIQNKLNLHHNNNINNINNINNTNNINDINISNDINKYGEILEYTNKNVNNFYDS